jgi:hypothetical protein
MIPSPRQMSQAMGHRQYDHSVVSIRDALQCAEFHVINLLNDGRDMPP